MSFFRRLSEVVSEDSEGSNDDVTDEFEHDINNLCIEEDFDLINFEDQARKFSINHTNQKTEHKDKSSLSNLLSVEIEPGTSQQQCQEPVNNQDFDSDKLKSESSGVVTEKQDSGNTTESGTSRSLFTDKGLTEGRYVYQ